MSADLRMRAWVALAAAFLAIVPAFGQAGTVEEVEVQGLVRMSREAFLHAFGIRAGDPYDPARIRSAFRNLWEMGLFADLAIEADPGPLGGRILRVRVQERPVLTSVNYEDNRALTRTQIEDRLRERKLTLDLGRPLDMKAVFAVEGAIRDYLAEKGHLDSEVRHSIREITDTYRGVDFTIRPGPKTRIRRIEFAGNEVFRDSRLRRQLKLTRPWRWYWPFSSKSLYHPVKWDQDASNVRDLYLDYGYLDVELRAPGLDVRQTVREPRRSRDPDAKTQRLREKEDRRRERELAKRARKDPSPREIIRQAEKERRREERFERKIERLRRRGEPKVRRWVQMTVPIAEGEQYRTGEITVSGSSLWSEEEIRARIPLREGMILSNAFLKAGIERVSNDYANRGHLYANVVRQVKRREGEDIADIHVEISEDKPYFVHRIEFTGNTSTQDRVLRREVPLNEGVLFNRALLDLGISKVNQLGYYEVKKEDVIIEPDEPQSRVDITFPGEEKGRNEIQVGGGYSGLDGAFFTGYYSTRNFLGRGQILSTSLQIGGRANRYGISFVEPWLFGRPYTLGFSLFKRDVDYGGGLRSSGEGGGIVLGRQLGFFTQVRLNYNYEKVSSTGFTITGEEVSNQISSITPSYLYYRIDNPYRPSRGWSFGTDLQIAGGPIGGDTNFLRPVINYSGYKRILRNTFLALHAEAGQIRTWQGGTTTNTAVVNGIPRFSRFWLGGDTQGPRVFETRTVTPLRFVRLDATGQIVETTQDPTGRAVADFDRNGDGVIDRRDLVEMGGDRYYLLQAEYVVPLQGPVEVGFFVDIGNSLFEDQSWGFDEVRVSAGVELRFYLPVFPVPLRLIYGVPVRKLAEDRTSSFTFSIGRSF
jgi:outer membrane protein insertion porin family